MLELKNGELAARPLLVLLPLLIIEELVNAITGVARIAIDNAVENFMFSFYYWRQQLLIDRIEVGDNVREKKGGYDINKLLGFYQHWRRMKKI